MKKGSFHRILLVLLAFGVFGAAICPYVCDAAKEAKVASHACCPDKKAENSQKTNEAESCCDNHDPATLKQYKELAQDYIQFQFVAFLVEFAELSDISQDHSFVHYEGPPGLPKDKPIYIFKSSFLI